MLMEFGLTYLLSIYEVIHSFGEKNKKKIEVKCLKLSEIDFFLARI